MTDPRAEPPKLGALLVGAMKGGAVAAVANMALYGVTRAAGVSYVGEFEGPGKVGPLPAFLPAVSSFVPSLFAGLIAFGLARLTAKAPTVFLIIAAVVTVLSMMGPINLGSADGATKAVLSAMHLVAAVPITVMVLRGLKR